MKRQSTRLNLETLEFRDMPSVSFPTDANVVDVAAAFGATPDDGIDDTAAVQRALNTYMGQDRVLFFRDGVYDFTAPLDYGQAGARERGIWLQGASQGGTVFRWGENIAAFNRVGGDGKFIPTPALDTYNGNTANAFGNYVHDLTVEVGADNPGATGIEFQTSNFGSMRNVAIRSLDPEGAGQVGLNLAFSFPGPMLVENLSVEGFDIGVLAAPQEYAATFDGLTLSGQNVIGMRAYRLPLSINGFESFNSVPAFEQFAGFGWGNTVITNAQFAGGSRPNFAVVNQAYNPLNGENGGGVLLLRNVTTEGYVGSVDDRPFGKQVRSRRVIEYTSQAPLTLDPGSAGKTLNLPVEATPEWEAPPLEEWASVAAFGALPNDGLDDTVGIQAALDSCASVVYFPTGTYTVGNTLTVGGNVGRVMGLYSRIDVTASLYEKSAPVFRFAETYVDAVQIDGFRIGSQAGGGAYYSFEQATTADLVIKDMEASGYRNTVRGGRAFIEDISGTDFVFRGQRVWGRQINPEGNDNRPNIVNDGGDLWILGLKTEFGQTVLDNRNGARSEILGGLIYPAYSVNPNTSAFINRDSSLSFSLAESSYVPGSAYNVWVRETRGGVTTEMTRTNTPINGSRLGGANINLYSSWRPDRTVPSAPSNLRVVGATESTVTLAWDAAADAESGVRAYRVYRGGQFVGSTSGTTFTDTGLPDGVAHSYTIRAENGTGLEGRRSRPIWGGTRADVTAPRLLHVEAPSFVGNRVVVTFSEPVGETNTDQYSLTGGVQVTAAVASADGKTVTLTTGSPLQAGVPYTLSVSGVTDRATEPNEVADGTAARFRYRNTSGGTGLTGSYYANENFAGTPATRRDATVDFDWGYGSPGVGAVGPDNFSVRWTGQIEPKFSEVYTFIMSGDDTLRLSIDGQTLIYRPYYSWDEVRGSIQLEAGKRYDIVVEMTEGGGGAGARLSWESTSQAREIVPASQLIPDARPTTTVRTNFGRGADTGASALYNDDLGANWDVNVRNRNFSTYDSSGMWLRFDLAGLDLTNPDLTDARLLLSLSYFGTGDGNRDLNIYGVPDEQNADNWVETGPGRLTWATAPGNNNTSAFGDPARSTFLGTVNVDNSNYRLTGKPDGMSFSAASLLEFLRSDTDGLVTLFLKRVQPNGFENTGIFTKEFGEAYAPALQLVAGPRG